MRSSLRRLGPSSWDQLEESLLAYRGLLVSLTVFDAQLTIPHAGSSASNQDSQLPSPSETGMSSLNALSVYVGVGWRELPSTMDSSP